jgi:PAS domain S-box-containing protein
VTIPSPSRFTPFATAENDGDAERHWHALEASAWLAAIIESSDDAILSKTLDGVITSWNRAAERLFGFAAHEAIGQSITIIIPVDRLSEETEIITRIRAGTVVDHFETIRRTKNGAMIDVSVTISPVRDESGTILGASKILRDISERKRADERQHLLLREMNHRIKNLFALTVGLVTVSARGAESVEELEATLCDRISSLGRAHALTLPDVDQDVDGERSTTLSVLLGAILKPYDGQISIELDGDDVPVGGSALTSIALLLHELATNAAKYGALSSPEGHLTVHMSTVGDIFRLVWTEAGVVPSPRETATEGFGTKLERASLRGLDGSIERNWRTDGLGIVLTIPTRRMAG